MKNRLNLSSIIVAAGLSVGCVAGVSQGQTLMPPFDSTYSIRDLGAPPGVVANFGGLFILPSEPNMLYIGGAANGIFGQLFRVPLVRDVNGIVTGFTGTAEVVGDLPYNDGGITPDPGGLVSYGQWPVNRYGQMDPATGLLVTDIDLSPLGVASSSSCVAFIPAGIPGAGGMRISSWSGGQYYRVSYSVGAGGIIQLGDVEAVPESQLPGGPEGFTWVPPGSPLFPNFTMIVSAYSAGQVDVYDVNGSGDPIISSGRPFLTGLAGAEGAAIDPVTGDFMFSTYGGGNRVIFVSGFVPPPPPCGWQAANCPSDSDGDGDNDSDDIVVFFGFWEASDRCADVDGDGDVDSDDLLYFFGGWDVGQCRP